MNNLTEQTQNILTKNGLDFTIDKLPMVGQREVVSPSGLITENVESDYFGLLNSKTSEIINTVKKGYTVTQNYDIVHNVLEAMQPFGSQIRVQKAGSLNGGRRVFIQLEIEGTAKVGDDIVKQYVTILDSNDGSTSLTICIGDYTISCSNQFYSFLRNNAGSKYRHTATIDKSYNEMQKMIQIALGESMEQVKLYNQFASTPVTRELAHKLINHLTGIDRTMDLSDISTRKANKMTAMYDNIEKEMNQKGNNLWGLHSGITSYTTHDLSTPKRENARIETLISGSGGKLNQKSLAFTRELLMA